ncbi:TBC1 domain family member 31 [Chelonus insularis]|uniref:TBC1 domain family member 31 n=1 Tax=Chelonus insularis TaxID=460826 RepID=UPI00158D2610|nr:TBC1 domain family member 31 [Chelonus insularis]
MEILKNFCQLPSRSLHQDGRDFNFKKISFDRNQERIIAYDIEGVSYLVEYIKKQWLTKILGYIGYPTIISFNPLEESEIITGFDSGKLKIFLLYPDLKCIYIISGHQFSPKWISFNNEYVLTTSEREVIIWNIQYFSKFNILQIKNTSVNIKKSAFLYSSSVIVLYENNVFELWESKTFNLERKIYLKNYGLKNAKDFITAENGQIIIFYSIEKITVFNTKSWILQISNILFYKSNGIKTITIAPFLSNYRYENIILVIFNNGKSTFFDLFSMHLIKSTNYIFTNIQDVITSENNQWIAWIQRDGTLNISSYCRLIGRRNKSCLLPVTQFKSEFHLINHHYRYVQNNIMTVLKYSTLKSILKEFNKYPKHYRDIIWIKLMKLPGNQREFSNLCTTAFYKSTVTLLKNCESSDKNYATSLILLRDCLQQVFPYIHRTLSLKKLVNPFLMIFKNNLLYTFEAILTILLNFCQKWFDYYPFPPLNILNIIENILIEMDPNLIRFYYDKKITSLHYAWPLLKTLMSEVLEEIEWLTLWDHLLLYQNSCFLIMCVVAFNIYSNQNILSLQKKDEIQNFFRKQNVIKAKHLISLSFYLHSKISLKNHPHQYLRKAFIELSNEESYHKILDDERPKFLFENDEIIYHQSFHRNVNMN